jgi:hypothetical protein
MDIAGRDLRRLCIQFSLKLDDTCTSTTSTLCSVQFALLLDVSYQSTPYWLKLLGYLFYMILVDP